MVYNPKDFLSNGHEVDKCRPRLQKYCNGIGLDIGCGSMTEERGYPKENKIVPHAIGVDKGYTNIMCLANDLHWFNNDTLDFVFSSHLLEHIAKYKEALKEWWRVLAYGGNLVLYLPHADLYPCIDTGVGNQDHKYDFTPKMILNVLNNLGFNFDILHIQTHDEGNEYSFDFAVRKTI